MYWNNFKDVFIEPYKRLTLTWDVLKLGVTTTVIDYVTD